MSCRLAAVLQVAGLDGVAFDSFAFQQDDLAAPEVDVGWDEVTYALVVPEMIAVGDEFTDLLLEINGQVVVLEQDPVLDRLLPALDFSLRLQVLVFTRTDLSRTRLCCFCLTGLGGEFGAERIVSAFKHLDDPIVFPHGLP